MRGLLDKSRKCAGGKTNENFCAGNAFLAQTKLYSLVRSSVTESRDWAACERGSVSRFNICSIIQLSEIET